MKENSRRLLMTWLLASLVACSNAGPQPGDEPSSTTDSSDVLDEADPEEEIDLSGWPNPDWEVGTPESQNLDSAKLEIARDYAFEDRRNTQSVLVIRNGVIVSEWYADGYGADDLVTSWSVGKSFLSAIVGIALERSELGSVDEPVVNYFPEWEGTGRDSITLRHALQMRSGLALSTDNIYLQVNQLTHSLEREVSVDPGTNWAYQNEDSMLVSGALERATGKSLVDYAEEVLFEPLGMDAEWWTDYEGNALGYCCIDATARDFARFGLLFLRGGMWKGAQLVPADWYAESVVSSHNDMTYGLHWWTFDSRTHGPYFAAIGAMSQLIWVYPQHDLVVLRNGIYTRHGSEPRLSWEAYHETLEPDDWDDFEFTGLVLDALTTP